MLMVLNGATSMTYCWKLADSSNNTLIFYDWYEAICNAYDDLLSYKLKKRTWRGESILRLTYTDYKYKRGRFHCF